MPTKETRESPFKLEAWIFWERVRLLTENGTGTTRGMPTAGSRRESRFAECAL
jgi:hypothetical protein